MLSKLRVVLETIERHREWVNEYPNGSQIASERPCGFSRATTYRWLAKAERMGLIACYDYNTEYRWFVTIKGNQFLGSWHEFQF